MERAEIDLRALRLFERLADHPGNEGFRRRLLGKENAAVLARVAALEGSAVPGRAALPTLFPGKSEGIDPPPGRVGPFRLIEAVGAGGMGQVWRAVRDDGLYDQTVAVKLLHTHLAPLAAARFAEERRILAGLEHPNIARLIDGGVHDGNLPWLATEYVDGQPLDAAAATLPVGARIRLLVKAADAVQFAHARLVVHADLKPSNILVMADGRVKLLDFGIAHRLGVESGVAGPQPMTPAYASPARRHGDPPAIADDVYALGILLKEIAGGSDADLDAIASKAVAEDEPQRYGSVAAFIADLDRWREKLPVTARRQTLAYRARRFIGRHRVGVALTVAVMLLLAATAGMALRNQIRSEQARREADTRFEETRSLARYQLVDLFDQLRAAPGTVAIRADLARRSALYLDRLGQTPHAPPALQLETAIGYRRLAAVQGLSGTSSLGQPTMARHSLDQAERLAQALLQRRPRDPAVLALLGWIYADRWTLLANNGESPRMNMRARAYFDRALALAPGSSSARLGRLTTLKSEAYDAIVADRPKAAIPILQDALGELRRSRFAASEADGARELESNLLNLLGDAFYDDGQVAASLPPYRAQVRLIEAMLQARGQSPDWLIRLGEAMFDLSGALSEEASFRPEALRAADRGIAAVERVLSYGPDANAEKKLVMLLGQKAEVLSLLGRPHEAVVASARSLAIRQARLARDPSDPARLRDVAIAAKGHADYLAGDGRTRAGCDAARLATRMWGEIDRRGELGTRDARRNRPDALRTRLLYCASATKKIT